MLLWDICKNTVITQFITTRFAYSLLISLGGAVISPETLRGRNWLSSNHQTFLTSSRNLKKHPIQLYFDQEGRDFYGPLSDMFRLQTHVQAIFLHNLICLPPSSLLKISFNSNVFILCSYGAITKSAFQARNAILCKSFSSV